MAEARQLLGLVVRGYRRQLDARRVLDALGPRLATQAARDFLARPPGPTAFVDVAVIEDWLAALASLEGEAAVRDVAFAMAKDTLGAVIQPVASSLFRLFGAGPAALYGHLPAVALRLIRGATFEYLPSGDESGSLELKHAAPCQRVWFVAWEGVLGLAYELCRIEGTVGPHTASPDGKVARFPVAWR